MPTCSKAPAPVIWVQEMLPRASVRQVLTHATVFACPSIYEPLGIANPRGDGLRDGVVVASAVGGNPEVVVDGETACLSPTIRRRRAIPSSSPRSRLTSRRRSTGSPATRSWPRRFGEAGRQRCIDEFSWAKIAQQTVDVYNAAIAAHGA